LKSVTALFSRDSERYVLNPLPTTMFQPSRRRSIRFETFSPILRPLLLGCSLALATACASMFKITPEEGAPVVTKPADKHAPKVENPKAEKPPKVVTPRVEKPKVEKPPKIETPKTEKPVEKVAVKKPEPAPKPVKEPPAPKPDESVKPGTAVAPPPEMRRSEPVIEPPALEPTPAGSDSAGIDRLTHAAVLWDVVRLFHPAAVANRAAWDNETVRRLTEVRSAGTRDQYANVLREWLSRLNDPVTRIVNGDARATSSDPSSGSAEVTVQTQVVVTGAKKTRAVDSTLVITWPTARTSLDTAAWMSLRSAVRDTRGATQIVIDLRARSVVANASADNESLRKLQLDVANTLASRVAHGAGIRRRVYEGWPDERDGIISPAGNAAWRVSDATVFVVPTENAVNHRRIAIVADSTTVIAPALMALVSTKQVTLVAEGRLSDRMFVPTTTVVLGNGLVAQVRTGELLSADGNIGLKTDTTLGFAVSPNDSAPALRTAVLIARGKAAPRAAVSSNVNSADATWGSSRISSNTIASNTIASNAWTNAHYPIMGARLLSVFKMWGTLRAFHAYNDLRDENIDDALVRFIPHVESATDAYSYSSVMLEYATTMNDAQAEMSSPAISQHLGAAAAPFATRWIEGRAIVTQVAADDAGRATGLLVGDEITAADGYPMAAYVNEHRKYGPASNEWTGHRNTTQLIPRGVPGNGIFKVRDANNRERTATIQRDASYLNRFSNSERATTSVFREFPGRIGYIDMDRATAEQVDSAFQILGASRALILDTRGRGMPNASATMTPAMRAVIRRVAALPNAVIDKQTIRMASEPCAPSESRLPSAACVLERRQLDDIMSADSVSRFKGRVVVLIDERTQGAMEQFGLGVEGVANPVFIGSPSAGAAGVLTSMKLPGFISLLFSGSELRHADGRQLQRVGLTPQVDVAPTVKGVRAGIDEVLARAQVWLLQQLDPAPPKRKQ